MLISSKNKIQVYKIIKSKEDFASICNESELKHGGYLDLSNLKFEDSTILKNNIQIFKYFDDVSYIKIVNVTNWKFPVNNDKLIITRTFANLVNLEKIVGLETWDISNVQRLVAVFRDCKHIKSLDLSTWNPKNLESMCNLFKNCFNLEEIKGIEHWKLKESMYWEFDGCFGECRNLRLDLSKWPVLDETLYDAFNGTDPKKLIKPYD